MMAREELKPSRWQQVKHALSSPSALHEALVLKSSTSILVNEDLAPSPPERRTWTLWNYFAYWWSESWNVSTWSVGASFITLGASVKDAILTVFFANLLSAVIIAFNGWAAARYHVGYPVLSRTSFGIYGEYFVVVLRSILGIIWGGVQLYFEGQFISVCLRCIFPGWARIHNGIPESQHITTQVMLGFFFAFLLTIPFLFIHTSRIQHLFSVKSFVMPLAGLGIVIWATTNNGGVSAGGLAGATKPSVSVLAWGIISQFNSVMGANSALLVTVPDLARYSKTKNAQLWGQLISLPLGQTLCASFGIITTVSFSRFQAFIALTDQIRVGRLEHVWRSFLESLRPVERHSGPIVQLQCPCWSLFRLGVLRFRHARHFHRVQFHTLWRGCHLLTTQVLQYRQRAAVLLDHCLFHRTMVSGRFGHRNGVPKN
jgi:nucleobase:cation symporter-1, NCS1 family